MEKLLWEIIEETKKGKKYLNSKDQYNNLVKILSSYDQKTVDNIKTIWSQKEKELTESEEFGKLHFTRGGIIQSGDDGFYMDFSNWVIAQGEELFNDFKENGRAAILSYIINNKVPEKDFMFECMIYAFHDFTK